MPPFNAHLAQLHKDTEAAHEMFSANRLHAGIIRERQKRGIAAPWEDGKRLEALGHGRQLARLTLRYLQTVRGLFVGQLSEEQERLLRGVEKRLVGMGGAGEVGGVLE